MLPVFSRCFVSGDLITFFQVRNLAWRICNAKKVLVCIVQPVLYIIEHPVMVY